jgi:predicted enzyme related to lactoylglutathione lyase
MTVVQEMEKAQADLAAALTERDDLAGKVTAAEAIASEASVKIVALEQAVADAQTALATATAESAKAVTERDEQVKVLTAKLTDAETKLKDPAYAAITAGDSQTVGEGGQATEQMTQEQALAKYNALEGVEAAKFRAEHRAELGLK